MYSVLNAATGFFLLAILEGISPETTVNRTLNSIKDIALQNDKLAILSILVSAETIIFIGTHINKVVPTPRIPAINPSIIVSALKTVATSFLLAPIALKIPISFVRSNR